MTTRIVPPSLNCEMASNANRLAASVERPPSSLPLPCSRTRTMIWKALSSPAKPVDDRARSRSRRVHRHPRYRHFTSRKRQRQPARVGVFIVVLGGPLRTEQPDTRSTVKICDRLTVLIFRSIKILGSLVRAAIRRPKLAAAVTLAVLAALASTMTYTGFLVVGVLADYLGTGRVTAGLLLGVLFARFPSISKGKLRVVGLLPKPARRPLIVSILALCLLTFLMRAEYLPALFVGFATAFLLGYPWLRRVVFDRIVSSVFTFTGRNRSTSTDDTVIEGEFREKKE